MNNIEISSLPDNEWIKIKHLYDVGKKFNFKKRTKNLLAVKKIFDDMGIRFFLVHGALLGAVRDKDFIKWDHDIELDVLDEDLRPKWREMNDKFIKGGFIVRAYKRHKGFKINLYRYKEKISIRGLYFDPERGNEFRSTKSFCYPSKFYENPEKIKFKDFYFDAPNPINDYLLYVYGKTWRKPLNQKAKLNKWWVKRGVKRKSKKR